MSTSSKIDNPFFAFLCIALPLAAALFASSFWGAPNEKVLMSALFCSAILLWVTEAVPLPVTGLGIPILAVLYGLAEPKAAFSSFGKDIIFLFIGAFLLAEAMRKHGWDKRLAFWVLSHHIASKSLPRLFVVVASISFILSMWVSNTATTAMLFPIVLGITEVLRGQIQTPETLRKIKIGFLLAIAYSASIGGISTPIGTPPNIITIGFLQERGISLSFHQWFFHVAPIAFLLFTMMLLCLCLMFSIYKPKEFNAEKLRLFCREELAKLHAVSRAEKQVLVCFLLVVFLWIAPGFFTDASDSVGQFLRQHLPMHVVGLGGGLIFFFLPINKDGDRNLAWEDAKHIDWGTVMLFGGGLTLGALLESTGLAQDIGRHIVETFGSNPFILLLAATTVAIFLTEVASNTASASIFVSILLGTIAADAPPAHYSPIIAVCLATSLSFMLPVATPPNAIIYGSGNVPIRAMMRTGLLLNIIGIAVVSVAIHHFGIGASLLSSN